MLADKASITELNSAIADIEKAMIDEADITRLTSDYISANGIAAQDVKIGGRRCDRVNVLMSARLNYLGYRDRAITSVTLKKNGNIYTIDTTDNSFMTSASIHTDQATVA